MSHPKFKPRTLANGDLRFIVIKELMPLFIANMKRTYGARKWEKATYIYNEEGGWIEVHFN